MEKAVELILSRFPAVRNRLDEHMLEVINGTIVALVLKVLGAGLAFLFNFLLARTLGAEGAGLYFLALTVTTIATVFGRMGLDSTLLRFTAAHAAEEDWKAVKGVYVKGMSLVLISSSIVTVVIFTVAPVLAEEVFRKPELESTTRWMCLAVLPMSLLILHSELLKGLKKIRESVFVFGVGVPAVSIVVLFVLEGVHGINRAVWAYSIGTLLTALLGVFLWRTATPHLRNIKGKFSSNNLLKSSIPLFWVASLNMLINYWAATFALGVWGAEKDVGIFSMASRTVMLISLILTSVNSIIAPKFAALYRKDHIEVLGSTARKTATMVTLMASPLLLLLLLFPEWVMGLYGEEFKEGAIMLSILTIGQIVNVITGSVGVLLVMSGNERLMRNNVVFVSLISIVLNSTLVPSLGAIGAAIATTICVSLVNIISVFLVWKNIKILTLPVINMRFNSL